MSLRHALLGLLAKTPQTGYDLAKRFELTLSEYAWHASHSQIYPELKKMNADGLVEVVDEGARGSRTYGITDDGRAELRRWMFSPPAGTPARSEFVLRLLLLGSLDLADARILADHITQASDKELADINEAIREIDAATPAGAPPGYPRFAAEFGRRYFELQRDWARWVLDQLERR